MTPELLKIVQGYAHVRPYDYQLRDAVAYWYRYVYYKFNVVM